MLFAQDYQDHYIPIARKYRPASFAHIIGQPLIIETLQNSIISMRVPQALLFTGIRGVGKTTLARIMAKALNCTKDNKPIVDFCNECEQCNGISRSSNPDIFEMDAASHTGVDDIRSIIESASYKPVFGRFKVYIIDEVHMLSNNAFNALLKTLEEPPAHLKFIFATTEIRKIPQTILSRCQRFNLRRVSQTLLQQYYADIVRKEGRTIDSDALVVIAEAADGSVRDGLSILDQAIALAMNKLITQELVLDMLGIRRSNDSFALFEAIISTSAKNVIRQVNSMYSEGVDPSAIMHDMLRIIYHLMKAYSLNIGDTKINIESIPHELYFNEVHAIELIAKVKSLMPELSREFIVGGWDIIIRGLEEMNITTQQWLVLEVTMIKLMNFMRSDRVGSSTQPIQNNPNTPDAPAHNPNTLDVSTNNLNNFSENQLSNSKADILQIAKSLAKTALDRGELMLYHWLMNDIYIVSIMSGYIKIKLKEDGSLSNKKLFTQFKDSLERMTGTQWTLEICNNVIDAASFTIAALEEIEIEEKKTSILNDKFIQEAISTMSDLKVDKIELNE